jgi:DNA-binding transcriptional LysR family regulator
MNEINLRDVDLNLLKAFKVLFEERNVGKSAQRLKVSQSAMSHTLARLRRTFDDKLFERIPNGMVATDKAIEISQPILSIINQVEALFLEQSFEPKSLNATVKIMTHDFIASNYLAEILTEIRRQAPLIKFDVQTYSSNCY